MRWRVSLVVVLTMLPSLGALSEEHLCSSSRIQVDENSFIYGKLQHAGSDDWEDSSLFSLCYMIEAHAFLVESYSGLVDWEHGQWTKISESRVFCTTSYYIRLPMRDSRLKSSARALGGALLLNLVVRKSHQSPPSQGKGSAAAGVDDTLTYEDSILTSSTTYIDYTMGTTLRQVNLTLLMQLLPPWREGGTKSRLEKAKITAAHEIRQTLQGLGAAETKQGVSPSSCLSPSFNLTKFFGNFNNQCTELPTDFYEDTAKSYDNSTEQRVLVAILCLFSWLPLTMLVTWSTRSRHNEKAAVCNQSETRSELYEKRLTDNVEEVLSRGDAAEVRLGRKIHSRKGVPPSRHGQVRT